MNSNAGTKPPRKFAESEAHGPWIQTLSGRRFYFNDPSRSEIHIDDIATALSRLNRWTGHCRAYNVADHSVRVMRDVIDRGFPELALQALMHDAHEAYVGDVSSPLKSLCPDLKAVEQRCSWAVRRALQIDVALHPETICSDLRLLGAERRDLFSVQIPWDWDPPDPDGVPIILQPLSEQGARLAFLSAYDCWSQGANRQIQR